MSETAVILYKLTDQGIRNIKEAPERIKQGIAGVEAMGGKVTSFLATLGEYDYVSVGEDMSDEAVLTFLLALGSAGSVRTTALKAFSVEEFSAAVSRIP
jgi:uncharacterized protein with GYD domain